MSFYWPPWATRSLGWLLTASCVCLLSNCDDGDSAVDGRLFISGVKDANGSVVGVAVDFVPARGNPDLTLVNLDFDANTPFEIGGRSSSRDCLALPRSGRVTLWSSGGTLTASTRVRVVARRAAPGWQRLEASIDERCSGDEIDDAVWPSVGASVPPGPPAQGGGGGQGGGVGAGASGSGGQGAEAGAAGAN